MIINHPVHYQTNQNSTSVRIEIFNIHHRLCYLVQNTSAVFRGVNYIFT